MIDMYLSSVFKAHEFGYAVEISKLSVLYIKSDAIYYIPQVLTLFHTIVSKLV